MTVSCPRSAAASSRSIAAASMRRRGWMRSGPRRRTFKQALTTCAPQRGEQARGSPGGSSASMTATTLPTSARGRPGPTPGLSSTGVSAARSWLRGGRMQTVSRVLQKTTSSLCAMLVLVRAATALPSHGERPPGHVTMRPPRSQLRIAALLLPVQTETGRSFSARPPGGGWKHGRRRQCGMTCTATTTISSSFSSLRSTNKVVRACLRGALAEDPERIHLVSAASMLRR